MGHVPRPLLILVAALLALCMAGGFVIGLAPSLKRGAADEEVAPAATALAASSAPVKDATPLAEPPPPPPKPKAPAAAESDIAPEYLAPAPPIARPAPPPAQPPTEAAPGAPPAPPQPKLPSDLPPV
jgi:hypothetical protein